jgi:tRNA A37 methylthiotransferase MiaB
LSNAGFISRTNRQHLALGGHSFADLLERVSDIDRDHLRVRFTSPHPKDYPQYLLQLMAERNNLCNQLHMPAQSGSSSMLRRMKRGYDRAAYLQLIDDARYIIPDLAISSDFIAGFCDETEPEHADTVSLLQTVRYDQAYLYKYSLRDKTYAARTMVDNVPPDVKQRRLQEIIDTFQELVQIKNETEEVGRLRLVLVEGPARRNSDDVKWQGRTDQNKRIMFSVVSDSTTHDDEQHSATASCLALPSHISDGDACLHDATLRPGDYAVVEVTQARGQSLLGRLLWREDSITSFAERSSDPARLHQYRSSLLLSSASSVVLSSSSHCHGALVDGEENSASIG